VRAQHKQLAGRHTLLRSCSSSKQATTYEAKHRGGRGEQEGSFDRQLQQEQHEAASSCGLKQGTEHRESFVLHDRFTGSSTLQLQVHACTHMSLGRYVRYCLQIIYATNNLHCRQETYGCKHGQNYDTGKHTPRPHGFTFRDREIDTVGHTTSQVATGRGVGVGVKAVLSKLYCQSCTVKAVLCSSAAHL
jgi:hypothetical protein